VFANLEAVLAGAGCGFGDVVKTTVFLADMQDFQAMNEVYARRFTGAPPARTTIAVAGLPKGARVEIEAVAFKRA
jgi:2-iminobutanoate/2-iminopropanoate deaminase